MYMFLETRDLFHFTSVYVIHIYNISNQLLSTNPKTNNVSFYLTVTPDFSTQWGTVLPQ